MHKTIQRINAVLLVMALILAIPISAFAANTNKKPVTTTVTANGAVLAIKNDNSLWAWGGWFYGTVGNGTREPGKSPVKIMDGVASVAGGFGISLAIKTDGSLWVWGNNEGGAIGTSNTKDGFGNRFPIQTTPVKRMDNVVDAAGGMAHWLALKKDGTLWAAGRNKSGQLGDGTKTARAKPVQVMSDVISIAASNDASFAIKSDGTLWGWGSNFSGILGDGTEDDRSKPVKIMDNVKSVETNNSATYAIKNDGTLWAWGQGADGLIGNGSREDQLTPVKIMDNVASVSAGTWSAFAIKTNGDLFYWGSNYYGTFGNGRFMKENDSPVLKPTKSKLTDVVSVFAGGNTYFMKNDGSLWGCGSSNGLGNGNKSNAIAEGYNVPIQTVPVKILDNVKKS